MWNIVGVPRNDCSEENKVRKIQEQVYCDGKTGVLRLSMEPIISVKGVASKEAEQDLINAKGTAYSRAEQSDGEIERQETVSVD